jgi:hypothetical protein
MRLTKFGQVLGWLLFAVLLVCLQARRNPLAEDTARWRAAFEHPQSMK